MALDAALPGVYVERDAPRRIHLGRWFPLLIIAIWAFLILFPGVVARQDPYLINMTQINQPPSWAHWFGTDEGGRDIFSRCMWGLRYSLGIAILLSIATALI